jgi:hypothetical protein
MQQTVAVTTARATRAPLALTPEVRERLREYIAEHGHDRTAFDWGTTPHTIRSALRGEKLTRVVAAYLTIRLGFSAPRF